MGSLGGPVGAPLGAAIGAAGGFTGGFLGAVLGYWWDLPPDTTESFGSGALYTAVTSGLVSALLFALCIDRLAEPGIAMNAAWGIPALAAFLSSLSRSLIDDFQARSRRGIAEEDRYR
jgi:hypothetical protein